MMNKRSTKRALLLSLLSLVMCVSMLIGTTYAWFTDNVTSANNIIKSGNLDVELYHTNKYITTPESVDGLTDLFTVEEGKTFLWEPGAVVWENFEVANKGSLALKYALQMNFFDATKTAAGKTLADVLKVAVVSGGFNGTRDDAKALNYNYSLKSFELNGALEAGEASDVYGIVIYWAPSAIDNDYNVAGGLSITLGVNLFATQYTAENDSFGPDYDVNAWGETASQRNEIDETVANINNDGSASIDVNAAPAATVNNTNINAPAGAFEPTDKVEVAVETTNSLFNVSATGSVVAALDITMKVNGEETSADLADGKYFTVTTYISKGLDNVLVVYTGTDGKAQPENVTYDAATGKLTFQTNHFSNYAVSGTALAYDAVNDTAIATIEQVIASTTKENNTVIIPEANLDDIEKEIEKLPEDKKPAEDVFAAAKIGDVTYATLAEAFAAAKDGETIVLLNNVAVTAGITNAKKITLNLNGKTVAGTDNAAGSFGLITNNGTLTITGEGKMTLVATNDRDWNAFSSVISNQPGGKLIVENGTIEHLGGTDMAYGIDNLTNGKGTYAEVVINGGTIKSPYRAIRQFLNGIEAQNILTVNGGTIEGANKSIWMQDPSANANTGKLTVSDKAVLNGDVYLYVCAGSTAWPVEVSIADAAVKSEVLSGNVPAGYRVALVDGAWKVLNDVTVVSTADELVAAINGDATYIQLKNDITLAATNGGYSKAGIIINKGQTLDGNGKKLTVTGANDTWGCAIYLNKGTVKNITAAGAMRGIFMGGASDDVCIENVSFGTIYTFNSDAGSKDYGVYISNSTMNGWTSYSNCHKEVVFNDCTFTKGNGYAFLRAYNSTEFKNCKFDASVTFELEVVAGAVATFENCYYGDTLITAENINTLGLLYNTDISRVTVK